LIAESNHSLLTGREADKPVPVGSSKITRRPWNRRIGITYNHDGIRIVSSLFTPSEKRIFASDDISAMEAFEHRRTPRTLVTYGVSTDISDRQRVTTAKMRTIMVLIVDKSRKSSTIGVGG